MSRSILCPSNTTRSIREFPREGHRCPEHQARPCAAAASALELRRLREAAGLTGDQVVERIGWASSSKVSRIENGRSRPDPADVLDLLDLYDVDRPPPRAADRDRPRRRQHPRLAARVPGDDASGSAGTPSSRPAARRSASTANWWSPGCSRRPSYARWRIVGAQALGMLARASGPARLRCRLPRPPGRRQAGRPLERDVDTEVAARTARQGLLMREVDPPRYDAVLEESAFTRAGRPARGARRPARPPLPARRPRPRHPAGAAAATAVIGDWYVPATSFSIYQFTDPEDPGHGGDRGARRRTSCSPRTPRSGSTCGSSTGCATRLDPPERSRRWLADGRRRRPGGTLRPPVLPLPSRGRATLAPRPGAGQTPLGAAGPAATPVPPARLPPVRQAATPPAGRRLPQSNADLDSAAWSPTRDRRPFPGRARSVPS